MRIKVVPKLLIGTMISFLLMACAVTGPKFTEFAPSISKLAPDKGRIYIYRTTLLGSAIQPRVTLNGEVIGRAVPRGFFYVDKKPGNYVIKTSTEVRRKLSLTLDKGQTRYVRLNISFGLLIGHVYPELVEPKVAKKEIQHCRYIGKRSN